MLPVLPRALSQAEQAKVAEACNQAAVVLDIDMSSGYPVISFLGMAERVRKVSSVSFLSGAWSMLGLSSNSHTLCAEHLMHCCA